MRKKTKKIWENYESVLWWITEYKWVYILQESEENWWKTVRDQVPERFRGSMGKQNSELGVNIVGSTV